MRLGDCVVDLARGRVRRGDTDIELTTREADLLRYLVGNPDRVIPRDELLAQVWGYADTVVSRACDNGVRRLREKIESDPAQPNHLLTVHGEGYRFVPSTPGPTEAPAVEPHPVVRVGALHVDLPRRRVSGPGGEHALTELEAKVLERLLRAGGAVVSSGELARVVGASVGRAVAGLRTKLEADPREPALLLTVRRTGYRLVPPRDPATAPRMFGRGPVLREIERALVGPAWVVLVGPGGSGKSRCARELVAGGCWLSFAGVDTLDGFVAASARQLGLSGQEDVDRIGRVLGRQERLVVLDDLEGLGARLAPVIDRWRELCASLRLLGTSRARIGAGDEVVFELGGLEPDDAVALFVARARAATSIPRTLDPGPIGALVARLDHLPLAIELAAARTATLGVADLADRLGLAQLHATGGDPRHRSLRAVVQASLDALPAPAIRALRALATFRHGFFVDDAEALLGEPAIDLLQLLRDHSLLRRLPDRDGGACFDTWEVVHELLAEGPEDPSHALAQARLLAERVGDPATCDRVGEEAAILRLVAHTDDLARAARAVARWDPELAARCAVGAMVGYVRRGPLRAGVRFADEVLDRFPPSRWTAWIRLLGAACRTHEGEVTELGRVGEDAPPEVAFRAHHSLATYEEILGRDPREALQRALAAARRRDRDDGAVELVEAELLPPDERLPKLRVALRRAESSGERDLLLRVLRRLTWEAVRAEQIDAGREYAARRWELASGSGLDAAELESLAVLAHFATFRGRAAEAAGWGERLAVVAERMGSDRHRMIAEEIRAEVLAQQGDFGGADAALAGVSRGRAAPLLDAELVQIYLRRCSVALRAGRLEDVEALAGEACALGPAGHALDEATAARGLAWIGLGDAAKARGLAPSSESQSEDLWACLHALLAAEDGDRDAVARHLDGLRRWWTRAGRGSETDLGRVQARAGAWAAERLRPWLG